MPQLEKLDDYQHDDNLSSFPVIKGDYLFKGITNGLRSYDISDPTNITLGQSITDATSPTGSRLIEGVYEVDGDYMYFSGNLKTGTQMDVWDVSDPTNMSLTYRASNHGVYVGAENIVADWDNDVLYIGHGGLSRSGGGGNFGLSKWDISTRTAPSRTYIRRAYEAHDLNVKDGHVIISAPFGRVAIYEGWGNLDYVTATDGIGSGAWRMSCLDSENGLLYTYGAYNSDSTNKIAIFDVSAVRSPRLIKIVDLGIIHQSPWWGENVIKKGNYIICGDNQRFVVINLVNPLNPTLITTVSNLYNDDAFVAADPEDLYPEYIFISENNYVISYSFTHFLNGIWKIEGMSAVCATPSIANGMFGMRIDKPNVSQANLVRMWNGYSNL